MISIRHVAFKNLLRKKTRTALTVIGIALSAWVLASLLGFNRGYDAALGRDIDNMGFQVLVTAKGCPYEAATLMLKGGTGLRYLNDSVLGDIRKHVEVDSVSPMLMQAVFDPNRGESGGYNAYLGVDPATFPRMKSYFEFKQGAWFRAPDAYEAVLGYEAAELEQREVGDKILIPEKNVELKVVGVLKRTGTQDDGTIFIPIHAVQKIFGVDRKLTGVGIKVHREANVAKLEEKLYDLPDVQVVSMAQVKQTISGLVATAKALMLSIALIAVLIAMVGVVNTILMSVFERFQEIGILKSMGAMPRDVFTLIWTETTMLCLAGGLLGVAGALALSKFTEVLMRGLLPYSPTGSLIAIDAGIALLSVVLVLGIGIIGGLYPAWKAASIRPLEALRREE